MKICPRCGSRVIPIRYGLPPSEWIEPFEAGEFTLGGCVVSDDDPKWRCPDCPADIWRDGRVLVLEEGD